MPHTWVGSDFLRSVARPVLVGAGSDLTLVLADGIPAAWLDEPSGGGPVRAEGLRTPWGVLDLTIERGPDGLRIAVGGDLTPPPGGRFLLRSLLGEATREVSADGRIVARGAAAREVAVPAGPVVFLVR